MKKITCKAIALDLTPIEVARNLSHLDGMIFFDSSGNLSKNDSLPLSIIAARPLKILKGEKCEFEKLKQEMSHYELDHTCDEYQSFPLGGAFGWLDYDGGYCFGIYDSCLIYSHNDKQWYEVGELVEEMLEVNLLAFEANEFISHTEKSDYILGVEKAKNYISSGDIYQVNLAQKFSAKVKSGDLFSLYDSLRNVAPAPMSAYFKLLDYEVLSSSPETFLKMSHKDIETRPIKGTRPRYNEQILDEASARELLDSTKERAELVMITDLERNDLGKVCEFGSVKVDEMLQLEKLEHVYHLVSKVSGTLREGIDHWDAIAECFPGGSITGAPKKRAMEIIAELENEDRGLYTGAVGYVGFNEVSQFNIVIRTLIREGLDLHYHVGAGIVADSEAEAEYEETIQKAKGIRSAIERSLNAS